MCEKELLDRTKAILQYLVNKGPIYQTANSLSVDFYSYTNGQNIPFHSLGFSCLLSFLNSIPDTLKIDSLTLEVQPARKSGQTRDITSDFRNKVVRSSKTQSYNFIQPSTTSLYQPRVLPWVRSAYDSTESCQSQRAFRPITKKPDPIIDNDSSDSSFSLGHRSFGDGKCSSPDSFKSHNSLKLNEKSEQQNQTSMTGCVKLSTVSNWNDPLGGSNSILTKTTNTSDFGKTNDNQITHSPSVATVEVTNDEYSKVTEDLENRIELDHSTASSTSISKELVTSSSSAATGSRFDESSSVVSELIFDDSPPPPYLETEDTSILPVNDGIASYDYDQHYYLSSPEEKVSVSSSTSSSDISAIPFTFTDDDDFIHMLDSDFFSGNYGFQYVTKNIVDVVKVGRLYEVYISETHNPYKFWFQLDEEDPNRIDQMQEQLKMYYNYHDSVDFIKEEHMKKGYACAALYNRIWHRGEIQSEPKDEKVKVFFVDYGTVDQVSIGDVRYLLASFCIQPKLCHRGVLDFVKPIKNRWEIETTSFFIGLVENKKLVAGVSEIDSETNSARLYLIDNESSVNINLKLVQEGHAFPDDPRERYQRHIADALPSFESLESGKYHSLQEVVTLLQQNYDYEELMRATIIDKFDCVISNQTSDEEVLRRVADFRKKKEEAMNLAKQRDANTYLQLFEGVLTNPFFNGTTEEVQSEIQTTNPFFE